MILYDVPHKMEEDLTQIGTLPKMEDDLTENVFSEDKGASYLRFARFFLTGQEYKVLRYH